MYLDQEENGTVQLTLGQIRYFAVLGHNLMVDNSLVSAKAYAKKPWYFSSGRELLLSGSC